MRQCRDWPLDNTIVVCGLTGIRTLPDRQGAHLLRAKADNSPLERGQLRPHHHGLRSDVVGSNRRQGESSKSCCKLLGQTARPIRARHGRSLHYRTNYSSHGGSFPQFRQRQPYQAPFLFLSWRILQVVIPRGSVLARVVLCHCSLATELLLDSEFGANNSEPSHDASALVFRCGATAAPSSRIRPGASVRQVECSGGQLGSQRCLPSRVTPARISSRVWLLRQRDNVRECMRDKLALLPGFNQPLAVLLQ